MINSIQQIDENILFFIQEHMKNPVLDRVMVIASSLGNSGFIWLAAASILLMVKRYQKCGISLLCSASFSTYIGDQMLKPLFHRVRPCNKFTDIVLLVQRLRNPSFPSGHTMVAFACATVLLYYDRRLGILGFLLASLIAFSRLYLFVHYPSDILGGIFFGVLTALLVLYGMKRIYLNLEKHSF